MCFSAPEWPAAKERLKDLMQQYPDTKASDEARELLKKLEGKND
jgi:hypothetical protein